MLNEEQKNYLDKLTEEKSNKIMTITPYNPSTKIIAEEIINGIKQHIPGADTRFMGASALEISGQNDIDIYIVCPSNLKESYRSKLSYVSLPNLGNKWEGSMNELETSIYLSDPEQDSFKEQVKVFSLLKNNPTLLKEYEQLKQSLNGKTYKEYQTAKYEFYNRVLKS